MTRYVALLRGVNVGGTNIKMADLAAAFGELGFCAVKTVLASGNVVFCADAPASELKPSIESALRERFSYEARVHVLTVEELRHIVEAFPFDAEREGWHPYVIFLMGEEPRARLLELDLDPALESIADGDGVLYWMVERGHTLDSVIGKASGRARFKALTTTRNLRTLHKLLAWTPTGEATATVMEGM
ncbi:MAG TPA: DUF1697 domain-containing protein [Microbacteriaceae bacterium]